MNREPFFQDRTLGRIRPYSGVMLELTRGIDALVVLFGMWVALRVPGAPAVHPSATLVLIAAVAHVVIGSINGIYRSWRSDTLFDELSKVFMCWVLAAVNTGFAAFVLGPGYVMPNSLAAWWFFISMILLVGWRVCARFVLRLTRISGHNFRRTAIVGATPIARQIADAILRAPWMGLHLVGVYDDRQPNERRVHAAMVPDLRGQIVDLIREAEAGEVDRVYITLPLRAEARIKDLIDRLSELPISILYVPDFFVFNMLHAQWEHIGPLHVVNVVTTPFLGVSGITKRIEDVVIGSLILVAIAIPLVLIAIAIKATSPGPAMFRQRRYGLNGKEFEIWKFRTMRVSAPDAPFVQATRDDQRVTPLGRFLRRTSLDELPQFINVIAGDMSIVGPRPHPKALDEQHKQLIPRYYFRQKIRPGITGLAQINGYRGQTDTLDKMAGRIAYDIRYIDQWSLSLDIKIIWLTIFRGFNDDNAV